MIDDTASTHNNIIEKKIVSRFCAGGYGIEDAGFCGGVRKTFCDTLSFIYHILFTHCFYSRFTFKPQIVKEYQDLKDKEDFKRNY